MKTAPHTGHTVLGPLSMQRLEDIILQSPLSGGRRRAPWGLASPWSIRGVSREEPQRKPRWIVGWVLAAVWLLALPAWVMEYRLQVTHPDFFTFSSYMEKATPW